MRFIAAIVSFVIAFALMALGISQRTIAAETNSVTASETFNTPATVTVVSSVTLRSMPGRQEIKISGAKKIFAAYGRTQDVIAWVGDASHNRVGFSRQHANLTNDMVLGKSTAVPNPQGSDLWLGEYAGNDALSFTVNLPQDISLIIVSDGTSTAPKKLSIRWPLDIRTPWAGPLITGGVLLLIVGIALYLWGLVHNRRARGPRRKSPKMPKVPRPRRYRLPRRTTPVSAVSRRTNRRRMIAIVPAMIIGALALSGCSPESWPGFMTGGSIPTPTPVTSVAPVLKDQTPPAVTVPQLRSIIARISVVAAKADADKDLQLAATRFDGAALETRAANYAIRKVDSTQPALTAIPAGTATVILPQQTDTWPRTVFAVLANPNDKTIAPLGILLEQKSARLPYKVHYSIALEAGTVLPELAAKEIGAPGFDPDAKLLQLAPSKLALAYGDVLQNGPTSTWAKYFDMSADKVTAQFGVESRKARQAALSATAKMEFTNSVGPYEAIALGSNDSGAIVAAYLNESVVVTPVAASAAVNPEGQVKSLSGLTSTKKGVVAVYGDQLLFYVPNTTSTHKIALLGFASGLVSAKELP